MFKNCINKITEYNLARRCTDYAQKCIPLHDKTNKIMKKLLNITLFLTAFACVAWAQKKVYIPTSWSYNATTQEYTEGGNADLQWSYNRSKQSDNCILFWQKGFGSDPSKAPRLNGTDMTFNVDAVLEVAERCYALNVDRLGFSCSNMRDRYKIIILMNYTDTWTCYGGGYDFACSALWLNPATVKPAGHSLAHEVGHSFHYMCYAESSGYSPVSSTTDNTGFHLSCGNGQAIWEQTAQWQANQAYPELMFSQSYPIFRHSHQYAFSHEWHRYQSYWFHYYLCQHYNDITTVAQVWRQPMKGQKDHEASDFNMALMALKKLSVRELYALYFDYACRCVTWDYEACRPYRDAYIGQFDYRCVPTADHTYQVALASCPQASGFNVIPLEVPAAGTTVTTHLTALPIGAPLADADPGEYYDGNSVYTKHTRRNYIAAAMRADRGFRMGYVALMANGERQYFAADSVYCQGDDAESFGFSVPEGVSRLWLVVAPAPKRYQKHKWDESILNDDMWPYAFRLEGTDIGPSAVTYYSPTLDGRAIANATFTYDVTFPRDATGYSGTSVTVASRAAATLGTAFQMQPSAVASKMSAWTSQGPADGHIMFYAANANGTLAFSGSTANGYGHWFGATGTVCAYASGYVFSEFDPASLTFTIGQFPGKSVAGSKYTIRQALRYRKSSTEYATALFVFNITVGPAASATLTAVDYADPTTAVSPISATGNGDGSQSHIYNVLGQPLPTVQSGLNIVNGKKVMIK